MKIECEPESSTGFSSDTAVESLKSCGRIQGIWTMFDLGFEFSKRDIWVWILGMLSKSTDQSDLTL